MTVAMAQLALTLELSLTPLERSGKVSVNVNVQGGSGLQIAHVRRKFAADTAAYRKTELRAEPKLRW